MESAWFRWSVGDVKEGQANLWAAEVFGQIVTDWPLTFFNIQPWLADSVCIEIIRTGLSAANLFLGDSGMGKSAVMKVLAMAFSRYHLRRSGEQVCLDTPCFREGSSLDFFSKRSRSGHEARSLRRRRSRYSGNGQT